MLHLNKSGSDFIVSDDYPDLQSIGYLKEALFTAIKNENSQPDITNGLIQDRTYALSRLLESLEFSSDQMEYLNALVMADIKNNPKIKTPFHQ